MPHSTISFASKSSKPIPITLGIDAVCVVASSKYSNLQIENLYAFTIYLQPLLPEHKCLPVRIIESKRGIGNKHIVDILVDTSRQLESLNFSVHFLAFDGDHCYNVFHHWFFNSYEKFLISVDLFSIINKFKYKKNLPIGDPLHIMKNQKSRFLKCVICLDVSGSVFFSLEDLLNTLGKDNQYLKDMSQLGAMRDAFALQLFDMNNIQLLLQKKKKKKKKKRIYYINGIITIVSFAFFIKIRKSSIIS